MKDYSGEAFLNKLYRDLHMSDVVMHTANPSDKPREKVSKYMKRLERIHSSNNDSIKNYVKNLYHKKYIIKEENLPSNLSEEQKRQIIDDQIETLDMWLTYLTDENANYPMWAKYWAFQGMLRIGAYDETTNTYKRRNDKTTEPFIEANPEVIARCIDLIVKQVNKPIREISVGEEGLNKLLESGSFQKLYTNLLKEQKKKQCQGSGFDGKWVKYNQGSMEDAIKLYNSLQGYGTNWEIAGSVDQAIDRVCGVNGNHGEDFCVYYTLDENNEYRIPRIVIRMGEKQKYINEIRGVADASQNLEDGLEDIVESKLNEFTFLSAEDRENYVMAVSDSKMLTKLDQKIDKKEELTLEENMFIFEANRRIVCFGWPKDPRIAKIRKNNPIKDYEIALKVVAEKGLALEYCTEELRNNFEVVMAAVTQCGEALRYASLELRNNVDIAKMAVMQNYRALEYAGEELHNNIEMVKMVAMVATQHPDILSELDEDDKWLNNYEVVMAAVTQSGYELVNASEELQNNYEIVKAAVTQHGGAILDASQELANSIEIVNIAFQNEDVEYLFFVEDCIDDYTEQLKNREINFNEYIERVTFYGWALQFFPEELKDNMQLVEAAVKVYGPALEYASTRLQNNPYLQQLSKESIERDQKEQEIRKQGKSK